LALLAALPVWGPGLVNTRGGGDSPFLLWRVHQLAANLRAGDLPARWMPDAAYGLGYPFFSYYAALPYYLASLFNLAGLDILSAIKLTQTLGFVLAAAASYGWFRRLFQSQAAAWLGAAAYTFAPFHLLNVYVRGDSLSEFYAFVFYPLILWAVDRAVERPGARSIAGLGLAYGGLMLTHNLSAFIFSPFALLYAALRVSSFKFQVSSIEFPAFSFQLPVSSFRSCLRPPLLSILAGLALGLALSAWLWVPAMLEMRYVQTSTLEGGYFHYSGHFRAANLVQPALGFVYGTTSEQASPFAMGLVQAVIAVLGAVINCQWLIVNCQWLMAKNPSDVISNSRGAPTIRNASRQYAIRTLFIFTGLLLSTLMITPLSRPVWDHLPLLPMVQFPWRFLSVQALFAAAASAFLVERLPRRPAWAALALAAALGLAVMLPLRPDRLPIGASDVTVERLQLYELFTANIGTTITYEWLPRDVIPRLYSSELVAEPGAPPRAFAVEGKLLSANETSHGPTARTWQVVAGTNARLVFPLLYWPGWSAAIDGTPTPVRPAHSSGRLTLDVPQGSHTVVLRLGRTPVRLVAELVSLAALVLCVVLVVSRMRYYVLRIPARRYVSRVAQYATLAPAVTSAGVRNTLYISPLLLLLPLLILSNHSPTPAETWTMDFIQMPYLHGGQVEFEAKGGEGGNTLVGYDIDQDHPSPGQSIHLVLNWAVADSPLTATVSLVSQSEHMGGMHEPFLLSQSLTRLGSTGVASSSHSLSLPPDLPTGVYLLQLRLHGADGERFARTAQGLQRGPLYLHPIYVQGHRPLGGEAVLATFGDRIHLLAVRAVQETPTQLLVELDWSASRPVAANYGIAVRLYNARGDRWAAIDTQPGYGFLPTVTWWPGGKLTDRLVLPLPEGLPPRDDYELEVILYDLADNLAGIGRYVQTGVSLTQYARRPTDSSVLATVDPHLALAMLGTPASHQQGVPALSFDAAWLVVAALAPDALARWSLVDGTGSAVATCTTDLPASTWPAGAYVLDVVHMPVPLNLPPARYSLHVTLLDAQTGSETGQAALGQGVEVKGRSRLFELPALDHRADVTLGGQLRWEGYSLARDRDTLRLTLAWRALEAMGRDYTVFVHLVDAQDAIVAQHDAMPLENAYPTSWWVEGEVVVDTVTLTLAAVPPGDYHLALGVYDGATQARLEARDALGQRLPADRSVLPQDIRVP
jgi:hypothetical protein